MKKDIHPKYYPVIFTDGDWELVTRSTMKSAETKSIDGVDHYVIPLSVSSHTHPYWNGGNQRFVDTAGRLERFQRKYSRTRKA
ncbi:MAG: 50S ribosomal protein L31 [Myxococcales bacterium]|nr:50S ribosomal protein L31 [Myxococcales bacterium]